MIEKRHMIEMRNERTGARRSVPHLGFSWTTFFLGPLVPLVRGDWKWALIMYFVIQVVASLAMLLSFAIVQAISVSSMDSLVMGPAMLLGTGIGLVVTQPAFAAIYNRRYYADLLNDGFEEWSS